MNSSSEDVTGLGHTRDRAGPHPSNEQDQLATSQLLAVAARALQVSSRGPLDVLGLSPLGMIALEYLTERGPMSQSHLAHLLYVRPQTAGHLLARLHGRGWTARRPKGKRNQVIVAATNEGASILRQAHEEIAHTAEESHPDCDTSTGPDSDADADADADALEAALEALRPLLIAIITTLDGNDHEI